MRDNGKGSLRENDSSTIASLQSPEGGPSASDAVLSALGLSATTPIFKLPGALFDVLPVAVYLCDQHGVVVRYNRRAAELWGRAPMLNDPDERFCGSFRMYRPDGTPLLHADCPMAEAIRTGIPVRDQEVAIERPDGSRGTLLVNIEAVRDGAGRIIGAVNCFQDISERTEADEQTRVVAREVDHRARNLLALVQATVHLTNADTADGLKAALEGRIKAISNAHTLLAASRWSGADLRTLAVQELSPYQTEGTPCADLVGPEVNLQPQSAQAIAMVLHELATNAVKYGALSARSGRVRLEWSHMPEGQLLLRWSETGGPPVTPPVHQGLGSRVIDSLMRSERGEIRYTWHEAGLACEISMPA